MEKDASIYSTACKIEKYTPSITVIASLIVALLMSFSMILWWAQVTVIPDDKRIIVFSKGIWNALNGVIPEGGQLIPISRVGDSLLWKNPQKNERKKNTSEVINKIIPIFNPVNTLNVCSPWKVLSREISRHHWNEVSKSVNAPSKNKVGFL